MCRSVIHNQLAGRRQENELGGPAGTADQREIGAVAGSVSLKIHLGHIPLSGIRTGLRRDGREVEKFRIEYS